MMKQYRYAPLARGSIRLLSLEPQGRHEGGKEHEVTLRCQLFDYPLELGTPWPRTPRLLFEALSYAWGNPSKSHHIFIDGYCLPITKNLHSALLNLRHVSGERVLWVDAICINQGDVGERNHQVKLMASIYRQAASVVVWLGDSYECSEALKEMGTSTTTFKNHQMPTKTWQAIDSLLRQPWFRRIWVSCLHVASYSKKYVDLIP